MPSNKRVVICFHFSIFEPLETAFEQEHQPVSNFHFSIFEPLETAELLLSINNQWFIIQIKNKKQTLFQGKNPALSRILAF